jgi:hypothetical protein
MAEQELKTVILTGRLLAIRVEYGVQCQIKEVINHLRQHPFDVLVRYPQVGVRVHLYEPHPEVLIYQKVKAKELEAILALMGVQRLLCRHVHIEHQIHNPLDNVLLDVNLVLGEGLIQILLECLEADGVAIFVLAIVVTMFL